MRLLAISPRITKQSGCVVATTGWLPRILTLGTLYRRVSVCPGQSVVRIHSRYAWWIHRQTKYLFNEIESITYGYSDEAPDALFAFAHDSIDVFSVGLRLIDDSEITLFHFSGAGAFTNNGPFPDWMYWDEYALDLEGSQESDSRAFVEVLSNLIGVSVTPPRA